MNDASPTIWFHAPTPAELNATRHDTMVGHLGIEFLEVGPDFISARMPVDARTLQPYGLLHGGASVALAETLGSVGAAFTVDRASTQVVGQEINANHIRAVRDGQVTGTARPVHLGSRSQVWGVEIRDAQDRLVCVSRITLAVIERRERRPAS